MTTATGSTAEATAEAPNAVRVLVPGERDRSGAGTRACALVNNMADAALARTEEQFVSLLDAAAALTGDRILVRRYSLPSLPRSADTAADIGRRYFPAAELWASEPDLVIITGAEPVAASLEAEPYWAELTRTLDWARSSGAGIVLSCLAAHAALQHWHGIRRSPLPDKCSGVFDHHVRAGHLLAHGLGDRAPLPHSRLNGIPSASLADAGYQVLLEAEVGWGMATRIEADQSLLLLQGHPEYGADTLLREYRRDLARYRQGRSPHPPIVPAGYLDDEDLRLLAPLAASSEEARPETPPFPFDELARRRRATWRGPARRILANWLGRLPGSGLPVAG